MSVPQSVQAEMQQTNVLFCSSVVKNREMDALDDISSTDARILPPGADLVQGRAQIKGFWLQAITGLGVTAATLATVNAEIAGDGVIEIGRASLTLDGGQTVAVKYVVQWKQED